MVDAGTEIGRRWVFLSNHFLVLLAVARDPDLRVREIAEAVEITERATPTILKALREGGHVDWTPGGRRSHYRVRRNVPIREPLVGGQPVGTLIDGFGEDGSPPRRLY